MSATRPSATGPTPAAVRAALERVLASEPFKGSLRKSRFLTFVVERQLANDSDHITSYDIAIGAFDRDERFDPDTDPLVRTAARRVRAALDRYYLTAGRDDPVRISIPKGHYIPAFERAGHATAAPTRREMQSAETIEMRYASWRARAWAAFLVLLLVLLATLTVPGWRADLVSSLTPSRDVPARKLRIAVGPLRPLGAQPDLDRVAQSMAQAVAHSLGEFDVVGPSSPADLQLEGTVQKNGSGVRLRLLLVASTGKVLWTNDWTFDGGADAVQADPAILDTVRQALASLAEPHP